MDVDRLHARRPVQLPVRRGDPVSIASFRIASYALCPFGRTVVRRPAFVGNVIYILFAGIWLTLGHLVTGALLMITIIGIPLARQLQAHPGLDGPTGEGSRPGLARADPKVPY